MEGEGLVLEEWDDPAFIIAVTAACQKQESQPPPPPSPPLPKPAAPETSYSPPRELSQRTRYTGTTADSSEHYAPRCSHFSKDQEIDRLKEELGRVSQQLNLLEKECSKLRKERDKKVELKVIRSRINAEETGPNSSGEIDSTTAPGVSQACANANSLSKLPGSWTKSCHSVGVQANFTTESNSITGKNIYRGSANLRDLWDSNGERYGKYLVAKLLTSCEAEFHTLFGYMGSSFSSNTSQNVSGTPLSSQLNPAHPIEAGKVSHLYSVLTKISNETSRLEDLVEALVDLCSLKNVAIIHGALCVLHMVLSNFFTLDEESGKVCHSRENVIMEKPSATSNNSIMNGRGYSDSGKVLFANVAAIINQGHIPDYLKLLNVGGPCGSGFVDSFSTSISEACLVSLFESMCLIAIANNEEQLKREALSVMNLILMRCRAYSERDKFAGDLVFQCLSNVLRRESGFLVQDQALHTLYLLCNSPKVMAMLCSRFKQETLIPSCQDINEKGIPTFQQLNEIFIGLADCLACRGSATVAEMKLRRNAVIFFAFLGSSGRSGFDILLKHRPPGNNNFLAIILQSLISDLELDSLKSAEPSDVREQTLLIREALIFFNRLVSHPQYSVPVLQLLTNTREMASMTVDLANRLTCKGKFPWNDGNPSNQIRESEIIDLARIFKRRVYTFLGVIIS